jgi:hypothetical protein
MADLPQPELPGPNARATADAQSPRKAKEGYKPSPQAQKLIDRVTQRLDYGSRPASRWALERQMFENLAFLEGIQWIEYSEQSRRFTKWNAPSWFPTPVDNQVAPRVLGMSARLLKSKPTGRVRPNTPDAKNREGARVAENIAGHIDDVVNEDAKRDVAALIASGTGTVIFYDVWNPQAGALMEIPRMNVQRTPAMRDVARCPQCGAEAPPVLAGTPCPQCQQAQAAAAQTGTPPEALPPVPTLQPGQKPRMLGTQPAMDVSHVPELDEQGQPVVDRVREGEIEAQVKMLFNFYWDPKARDLEEARWCGELCYLDLDWFDQNFPKLGPYVAEESGADTSSYYEASLTALVGPSIQGTAHYGGGQNLVHGAVARIYQEKPSADYEKGIWAIIANGVLLYPEEDEQGEVHPELPIQDAQGNPTGEFNYTEFKFDIAVGRFPGRTPLDDMVPLQRKVNGIDAQILMNRKTLLNPWVLAPKGSGLVPGQVAMRPAATIVYNFVGIGQAPQVVKGEALPNSIYEERTKAEQSMDRLAQSEGMDKAQAPQGMKSGVALNFMREKIDEEQSPRLGRWARCMAARKRKQLLLAQKHYREPRAIKLLGNGKEWEVHYWQGSDLAGNTDVTIDPGTVVPRSPAIKTQLIFDAAEQHLIDFQDPKQKQKALEILGLQDFETEIGPDMRRATKENAEMDEGQPAMVNQMMDNHEVHLTIHIPRQKDPSFDALPETAKRAHLMHVQQHRQILMQQKMASLKGAQAGGQQPGGPGGVDGKPGAGANGAQPPAAA